MKLESNKIEPNIIINGVSLAQYVDQEHTKEIRQHRTEELNHFSKIKKRNTKCYVVDTTSKDAKTTTKIFPKWEIRRENFMINKEGMKNYDLENKGVIAVYLIYAAYEWKEICKEMFEMKLFNRKEHEVFNLTSLEIFLQYRYGSLICDVAKFSRDKTSSVFNTIHKKLNGVGLIEKYRKSKSVTNGFYYEFKDEFYKMPIQQVLGLIFPKKSDLVKDPNLLCLNAVQLKEKIQAYQGKPYSKEFDAPKIKPLKYVSTPKANKSKSDWAGNARTEVHGGDNAEGIIENIRRKQENIVKSTTAFLESEKKTSNFEEIVKILNKNGILMKESVIYPNGVIKITYI